MKKIILLMTFMFVVTGLKAQQLKIYRDEENNFDYFAVYAYGLPREVVKTNAEIKESKFGETGITHRHHTTKTHESPILGGGVADDIYRDGRNANIKVSFAFLIAPYNVDKFGEEIMPEETNNTVDWYAASGWMPTYDKISSESVPNPSPTGCAAYTGHHKTDKAGSWRLPTQREAMIMFTVMEHALTLENGGSVENHIVNGPFWTSTEFNTTLDGGAIGDWIVWRLNTTMGMLEHVDKFDAGQGFARCVKDIDNDPINEF